MPTPLEISHLLTARLTMLNLGDGPVAIAIELSDEDLGQSGEVAKLQLAPLELLDESVPEGTYRVVFTRGGQAGDPEACVVELGEGDTYRFVVFPDAIAVFDTGHPAASWEELIVGTSSLCKATA